MNMTEKEYRQYPSINYSSLSRFNQSQDHCLMPFEYKSYFEFGKMFETLLQDAVTGSSTFSDRFFYCGVPGTLPDDLISLIDSGANLENEYVYTKKGERSKTFIKRHAFLDAAIENPGKIPVSMDDKDMLEIMLNNMLNMQYMDMPAIEFLSHGEWQVPILWECDSWLKKKALVDCLVTIDGTKHLVDIKTAASLSKFNQSLSSMYWIQDLHYTEGVRSLGSPTRPMVFFVASKEKPYLAKPVKIDWFDKYDEAVKKYHGLCSRYEKWVDAGRPAKGYLPVEMRRVYI